jgi:hypothetical protein
MAGAVSVVAVIWGTGVLVIGATTVGVILEEIVLEAHPARATRIISEKNAQEILFINVNYLVMACS